MATAADEITGDDGKRGHHNRYVNRPSMREQRGFACIGLDRPTDPVNIGHALRSAFCFDARMVILGKPDPAAARLSKLPTDPMRSFRHIPVIKTDKLTEAIPQGAEIVAVEIAADAVPLMEFTHPERACYVFGPENGSISEALLKRCHSKVMIPTMASLNLGMCVNIVLYDRLAKSWSSILERRKSMFFRATETLNDGS